MSAVHAAHDVLSITASLQRDEGGAMEAEIHAFAYLACLMTVYDGHDPSWWQYRFTATTAGAPYAYELGDATDHLAAAGALLPGPRGLVLSAKGDADLGLLGGLSLGVRDRYLEAATATALMLLLPSVPEALTYEPQLKRALAWTANRELLEPEGLQLVRHQFEAITEALDNEGADAREDLMVPAVVWLAYLLEESEQMGEAA